MNWLRRLFSKPAIDPRIKWICLYTTDWTLLVACLSNNESCMGDAIRSGGISHVKVFLVGGKMIEGAVADARAHDALGP